MTRGIRDQLFLCLPAVSFLGSIPKELEILWVWKFQGWEHFLKAMDGNKDHYKQSNLIFL